MLIIKGGSFSEGNKVIITNTENRRLGDQTGLETRVVLAVNNEYIYIKTNSFEVFS